MDFVKPIILKNGFEPVYWKLSNVNVDVSSNNVSITLSGYKDEQSFMEGKDAADSKTIEFNGEQLPSLQRIIDEIISASQPLLK